MYGASESWSDLRVCHKQIESAYTVIAFRKPYLNKSRPVPQNGIFFKLYLTENMLNLALT